MQVQGAKYKVQDPVVTTLTYTINRMELEEFLTDWKKEITETNGPAKFSESFI